MREKKAESQKLVAARVHRVVAGLFMLGALGSCSNTEGVNFDLPEKAGKAGSVRAVENRVMAGQGGILAESGFNDQSGIHGNPVPNSPFAFGITVDKQGIGEAGWDMPWQRLGGPDDRAPVSTEYVYEGDGAVKLFADNVFGTSLERAWTRIVPQVRIDVYVLVRPAAEMMGNAVHTAAGGEIAARRVAYWHIAGNGEVRVFDKVAQREIPTGFSTLPNEWTKYSMILDSEAQTWRFLFNDKPFESPRVLVYITPSNFVDRVNLSAVGTLTTYVDAVRISVARKETDGK